ncbi:hypothetical protein ScPMuIL_018169 [Solemya velum]
MQKSSNSKEKQYTKLLYSQKKLKKVDRDTEKQNTISKFFAPKRKSPDDSDGSLSNVKTILSHLKRKPSEDSEPKPGPSKRLCIEALENPQEQLPASIENRASTSTSNNDATVRNFSPSNYENWLQATKRKLDSFSAEQLTEPTVNFENIRQRCGKYANSSLTEDTEVQIVFEEGQDDNETVQNTFKKNNFIHRFERSSSKPENSPSVRKTKVKYTPLEQQVVELKEKYPDALLFIECGYKYRFFGEDAEVASRVLNIFCRMDHNFMTASIPTYRLFVHVRRLVAAGYKVGVVKQTETAALKAAGDNRSAPFTRTLSAFYTKSTLAVQPATGDLVYDCFDDNATRSELETRISHIQPVELLISNGIDTKTEKLVMDISSLSSVGEDRIRVERLTDDTFLYSKAFEIVSEFYSKKSADSTTLQEVLSLPKLVITCLSAVITYLREFKLDRVVKDTSCFSHFCMRSTHMYLNGNAVRQLELFVNQSDKKERGSLFNILNHTVTKFGARMLRTWMKRPLLDISNINKRQAAVSELSSSSCAALKKMKDMLVKCPDLEKGLCSIYHKKCSTSEFYAVCKSFSHILEQLKTNKEALEMEVTSELLKEVISEVPDLLDTSQRFYSAIQEKGARNGVKTELFKDESMFPSVMQTREDVEAVYGEIQEHRRAVRLQLRKPSLDYITVSGTEFLIEVKNTELKLIPNDWTKVSSTKSVSRFHTPFIEEKFRELSQLRESLTIHCNEAWQQFLGWFGENYHRYRKAVKHLAILDCLFSMAVDAQKHGYCRPEIVAETGIEIAAGCHPIINEILGEHKQFVPNDTNLHQKENMLMVITGPNMGGKSSYIKQVALITIMSQMGANIPAESAKIGVVDAIFTRMGAADDIYRGRSTFMVELQEVSEIMEQATDRSLVILDELGRGTSTHDGVAIACATLEYFIKEAKCMTLFVTHYPLLAEFEQKYPGLVRNFHMSFMINEEEEKEDDAEVLIFLYQLVSGMADRSYGLNVARLAGIPTDLINIAAIKARELEDKVQSHRKTLEEFTVLHKCDEETVHKVLTTLKETRKDAKVGS